MSALLSPYDRGLTGKDFSIWTKFLSFVKGENRWHRYRNDLRRQILARGKIPDSVWESPERLAIARKIEDILAANCWDEPFRFHPDDPYAVVGEFEVGDLSEVEAVMDIEDSFDIKIPDKALQGTFAELVDYILCNTVTA